VILVTSLERASFATDDIGALYRLPPGPFVPGVAFKRRKSLVGLTGPPAAARRSSNTGMAVVSLDFSAIASWPSTSRLEVANAETKCSGARPVLRS
jgi:hypothetical protein